MIVEFKNLSQAYDCLEEWKQTLFLTDWIIKLKFEPLENAFAHIEKTTD